MNGNCNVENEVSNHGGTWSWKTRRRGREKKERWVHDKRSCMANAAREMKSRDVKGDGEEDAENYRSLRKRRDGETHGGRRRG